MEKFGEYYDNWIGTEASLKKHGDEGPKCQPNHWTVVLFLKDVTVYFLYLQPPRLFTCPTSLFLAYNLIHPLEAHSPSSHWALGLILVMASIEPKSDAPLPSKPKAPKSSPPPPPEDEESRTTSWWTRSKNLERRIHRLERLVYGPVGPPQWVVPPTGAVQPGPVIISVDDDHPEESMGSF
ncbi:hypothetical protein DM860_011119 [Cuscuta australis]|uniref:Uncharacterized protein n=1 Tax=Cuscuta australis TaxID=267555 RepID=A0A328DE29_9ASTE|nr:hypothetical protein DM860_011119 [Cuscuta australis]